jgi:hypothetical protein
MVGRPLVPRSDVASVLMSAFATFVIWLFFSLESVAYLMVFVLTAVVFSFG